MNGIFLLCFVACIILGCYIPAARNHDRNQP